MKYYLSNASAHVGGENSLGRAGAPMAHRAVLRGWQEAPRHGSLREPQLDRVAPTHAVRLAGDAVPAAAQAPLYKKLQR